MFTFLKKLFGSNTVEAAPVVDAKVEAANSAPYKVEAVVAPATPAPAKKAPAKKQQFAKKAPAAKKATPAKKPAARKPKAKPAA